MLEGNNYRENQEDHSLYLIKDGERLVAIAQPSEIAYQEAERYVAGTSGRGEILACYEFPKSMAMALAYDIHLEQIGATYNVQHLNKEYLAQAARGNDAIMSRVLDIWSKRAWAKELTTPARRMKSRHVPLSLTLQRYAVTSAAPSSHRDP